MNKEETDQITSKAPNRLPAHPERVGTKSYQSNLHGKAVNQETLGIFRSQWIEYISSKANFIGDLSRDDQHRIALTEFMYRQELDGRHLFHLTLTYKPFGERQYQPQDADAFFKSFYVKYFLPRILNTRNIHTKAKKLVQPICFAFIDEHEPKGFSPNTSPIKQHDYLNNPIFVARLHHHAILAVHRDNLASVESFTGENTFEKNRFTAKVMTSDIRTCEPMRLLYASKLLAKYPDFLSFPDKFSRDRQH